MVEKKLFSNTQIETKATEESLDPSRQKGEILRRPTAMW
jgi:hypothetical protein